MKRRLMILGASRYYIRSIIAARELGYEVVVTDRNPESAGFRYADHHEVVDIADIDRSIDVARKYKIDGVIALHDFGVRTAASVAEYFGLVGISPQVASWATDKASMRRRWEEAGVPSARFRVVDTIEEAYGAVDELDMWPLVVKPADSRGGGSRGVSKVENRSQLKAALEFAQSFYKSETVVIEEFLEGIEHSVETITYGGETHILAVSDKQKTRSPYRVDKRVIYPTLMTGKPLERIHESVKAAVRTLGVDVGPAHVELCTTRDGPRLFELGARCGGGGTPDPIVPFLTGVEMFKEVVRISQGEKPKNLVPRYMRGCVYLFLTPQTGIVKGVRGLEAVRAWENILDCEVLLKAGDEVREVKSGGDRVGFIIAGGETRQSAIALADRAERSIHFEYA
jgi:biotin carboxylase